MHVRRFCLSVTVLIAALVSGLLAPTAATASESVTISGSVSLPQGVSATDAYQAMAVDLLADWGNVDRVPVDSSGHYSFSNVRPGSYSVRARTNGAFFVQHEDVVRTNIISTYFGANQTRDSAQRIDATASHSGVDIAVRTGQSISGRVSVPDGTIAEWQRHVQVGLSPLDESSLDGEYADVALSPDGAYTIVGVPADDYLLEFRVDPDQFNYIDGSSANLVSQYWRDATRPEDATPLSVTADRSLSGVDIRLSPTSSIAGRVTFPAGTTADVVKVARVDVSNGYNSVRVPLSADGTFSVKGLKRATYTLSLDYESGFFDDNDQYHQVDRPDFLNAYYDGATRQADAKPIDLSAFRDVTGIDVTVVKAVSVSGVISLPPGMKADNLQGISVRLTDSGRSVRTATPDSTGRYVFDGLEPGRYYVSAEATGYRDADDRYVTPGLAPMFWPGTADEKSAEIVDVSTDVTGIDLAMTAGRTISGTVSVPAGTKAGWDRSLRVVAAGADDFFASTVVDVASATTGTYRLGNLPAGDYTIKFEFNRDRTDVDFVDEYYPDTQSQAQAARIRVDDDTPVVDDVDADLATGGALKVSLVVPEGFGGQATVLNATGDYVSEAFIVRQEGFTYPNGRPQDGTFRFSGLVPGMYYVSLDRHLGAQLLAGPTGRFGVRVTAGKEATLVSTPRSTDSKISGTLTTSGFDEAENVEDLPLSQAVVYQRVDDTWMPLTLSYPQRAYRNGSVAYSIGLAPGTYTVGFGPSERGYTSDGPTDETFWSGKPTLDTANRINLSAGKTVSGINGSVSPVSESGDARSFIDITDEKASRQYTPFFKDIRWMIAEGITTGYQAGERTSTYRPLGLVTREAMAAFLYRAAASPTFTAPTESPFADVAPDAPFFKEIAWMASEGLTTGYAQTEGKALFKPKGSVSREAMAAFLFRLSGDQAPASRTSPFADVASTSLFRDAILWMNQQGISTGTPQKNGKPLYKPRDSIKRDAMAAFLHRFDQR